MQYGNKSLITLILLELFCVCLMLFYILRQRRNYQAAIDKQKKEAEKEAFDQFARELHDHVAPSLLLLRIQLEQVHLSTSTKSLQNCIDAIERLLTEIQQLSVVAPPLTTCSREFGASLQELLTTLAEYKGIDTRLTLPASPLAMGLQQERALLRMVQEGVQNVVKHAAATTLSIAIAERNDHVEVCVEDNGKGFDHNDRRHGSGLRNMQQRAQLLNGEFICHSAPGAGTKLLFKIPKS